MNIMWYFISSVLLFVAISSERMNSPVLFRPLLLLYIWPYINWYHLSFEAFSRRASLSQWMSVQSLCFYTYMVYWSEIITCHNQHGVEMLISVEIYLKGTGSVSYRLTRWIVISPFCLGKRKKSTKFLFMKLRKINQANIVGGRF